MRENSRRGAPRSVRAADRTVAGRDRRARGAGAQGGGRPGQNGRQPGQPGRGAPGAADITRLTSVLEPVLAVLEMDLEDVRLSSAGRRRVLRIVVDADGGVSLDDITEVSREVSARLDAGNVMGDAPYTLEVSSPGVDRPLTEPRHWRRAAGRLVSVPLTAGDHDQKRQAPGGPGTLIGRVIGTDQDGVTLEIDGARRTFGYPELGAGRVQVEFGRETDNYFEYADSAAGEGADEEEPRGY